MPAPVPQSTPAGLVPSCPGCPGSSFNVLVLTIPCESPDCNTGCFNDPTWGPSCQSIATWVRNDDLCEDPPCSPSDAACQDILQTFGSITAAYLNSGEPVFGSEIVCFGGNPQQPPAPFPVPECPPGYTYDFLRETCVLEIPPPVIPPINPNPNPLGTCPPGTTLQANGKCTCDNGCQQAMPPSVGGPV